ncbi:restriction endonuclease subunit S [Clostridia bacterium]|nr:restriction endonuclease subunit S [Clostridia bacterium]
MTNNWEQRKLNAWADRYDNLRVPITALDRVSGSTPYYGANGIQDYVEGYTHDGEFILVAEDGASDLKNYPVQYVNGRIWVNNHAHVLQAKKEIADNKFLKYVISQTNIEPYLVGGGRAKLNADTMMRICIIAPENLAEQKQLGLLFQRLDNLITLHQRKPQKEKSQDLFDSFSPNIHI